MSKAMKKTTSLFILVLTAAGFSRIFGQEIVKKDPALDAIVDRYAEIKKVADGFQFTEGPVWSPEGFLLFSDIPAERIYKWDPDNGISVYLEHSGGSNGLTFDAKGDLIACQHIDRRIARLDENKMFRTVTATWNGKKFNSPNDLTVKSDGSIYFTDPAYGLAKGVNDPAKEIPFQGVYRYIAGQTILVDSTLDNPNGIAFSPDEKYLYVANYSNGTGEKQWVAYKLNKKGEAGKRKVFADATSSLERGGPDGMKVDLAGNVYCTGPGGVLIYSPKGTYLGLIRFPEIVANLCFGGNDGKTLFVTARTGLYSVQMKTAGISLK